MSKDSVAEAVGKIPSGIFVVTAKKGEEEAALLASWVQQVSFDPLRLSMAVKKDRPIERFLKEKALFAIHILGKTQKHLYQHFAKVKSGDPRPFEGINITYSSNGSPILSEALAVLECRVVIQVDGGDHQLMIADIEDGKLLQKDEPRTHVRKSGSTY